MSQKIILEVKNLSKEYFSVTALSELSFDLREGEIHVLFGENGAGKSTTISIIAGATKATRGEVLLDGKIISLDSVQVARSHGISAVFQEFSLIENMTVEENLFLSAEKNTFGLLNKKELHDAAVKILHDLDFDLNPKSKVAYLTRAEQQMVEIAKAFREDNLRVLILDEPTASLTDKETQQLYKLIDKARSKGVGIIYITHRMAEIDYLADRITILRDGKFITTVNKKDVSEKELIELMTGRVIDQIFPDINCNPKDLLLETQNLKTQSGIVKDVSIKVHRGEIIGLAGLVGSGKSFIARSIFGLDKALEGKVIYKNEDCTNSTPKEMLSNGLVYLPPNRKEEGLLMDRNSIENISLSAIHSNEFSDYTLNNAKKEKENIQILADKLSLYPNNITLSPKHFSGGNQQKIMLLKSLVEDMDLIILDEPTVGVDVGTRSVIYNLIKDLCEAGKAIIIISSDLPEVLNLASKVYVFYGGYIQAELEGEEITEQNVLNNFFEKRNDKL